MSLSHEAFAALYNQHPPTGPDEVELEVLLGQIDRSFSDVEAADLALRVGPVGSAIVLTEVGRQYLKFGQRVDALVVRAGRKTEVTLLLQSVKRVRTEGPAPCA